MEKKKIKLSQIPFVVTLSISDITIRKETKELIEGIFSSLSKEIQVKYDDESHEKKILEILDRDEIYDSQKICYENFWQELSSACQLEHHFEIVVVDKGLKTKTTNFVYGHTICLINNNGKFSYCSDKKCGTIISLKEINDECGKNEWQNCFSVLFLHELGHFFGLPPASGKDYIACMKKECKDCEDIPYEERERKYNNSKDKSEDSPDFHHCNNSSCVMEQVDIDGRPTLSDKTRKLMELKKFFCEDCKRALGENLQKFLRKFLRFSF